MSLNSAASAAPGRVCAAAQLLDPFFRYSSLGAAALANVNTMEVVSAEGGVAFGTLPLARVVACLDTLEAENVEALCQHSILHPRVAARTC